MILRRQMRVTAIGTIGGFIPVVPPKQAPAVKRVCKNKTCTTVLSRYNEQKVCSLHTVKP